MTKQDETISSLQNIIESWADRVKEQEHTNHVMKLDLEVKVPVLKETIKELEERILIMSRDKEMSVKILAQQQQLTLSLQALANKQLRTKLILGILLVKYIPAEPQPSVRDEMGKSRARVRMQEESANIVRLAMIVDKIADKYSPANTRSVY